ncbi:nuclear transport factor 2 family protein [Amycolatopsis sp. K13G38]|uniref:Nuclear transport factor 2 family protein n=1 Tax=Amycolatopsis acididurans TaxID=2724524 RepID=A0ABX1J4H2_9PSEU|nr:nuclear transport factor 2 family protein [Amycolatopsis acididurans]NKQ54692.1 nuclear transport factor 2 family protein [Amycolatopsis acididurans]
MVIEDYYARLDGPEPLSGLDLLEPDVEFLLALPGKEVTGRGRDDMRAYVAGRPAVGRRHNVVRRGSDGDLEMVYGFITEQDGRGTGSFTSVVLLSPDKKIARYQSFFSPAFNLFPLPEGEAA